MPMAFVVDVVAESEAAAVLAVAVVVKLSLWR